MTTKSLKKKGKPPKPSRSPRGEAESHMPGREYRAALKALGLSIAGAAKLLHIDVRTSRRRANEQAPINWETAALLRLMVKLQGRPEHAGLLGGLGLGPVQAPVEKSD